MSDRFWAKTERADNGCLIWRGVIAKDGYGKWRSTSAHRAALDFSGREVPPGMQIDHLCRNRACVEPSHLEVVTRRENIMRSTNFAAINAAKTHCRSGHPYDEANTYVLKGERFCRACNRERAREYKQRRRAQ